MVLMRGVWGAATFAHGSLANNLSQQRHYPLAAVMHGTSAFDPPFSLAQRQPRHLGKTTNREILPCRKFRIKKKFSRLKQTPESHRTLYSCIDATNTLQRCHDGRSAYSALATRDMGHRRSRSRDVNLRPRAHSRSRVFKSAKSGVVGASLRL